MSGAPVIGSDTSGPTSRSVTAPAANCQPTCTNCRVPMNLCHCSKSCCSSCSVARAACCCILARPAKTKVSGLETHACEQCTSAEIRANRQAERAERLEGELTKASKEAAKTSKLLGEARASEQQQREARTALETKLCAIEAHVATTKASAAREASAELSKQLAAAWAGAAAQEERRRSAEEAEARARSEVRELRDRVADAERRASLAEDQALQYVAEADERDEVERSQSAAVVRATAAAAAARKEALEAVAEAEASRLKVAKLVERLESAELEAGKAREAALAYEGACAEAKSLRAELLKTRGALSERSAADTRVAELEVRVRELEAEGGQLRSKLAHAERVQELMRTVTSRTNEVQQAAEAVMRQAEAAKAARQSAPIEVGAQSVGLGSLLADPALRPEAIGPPHAAEATKGTIRSRTTVGGLSEASGMAKPSDDPHSVSAKVYGRMPVPPTGKPPASGRQRGASASRAATAADPR
jgi:hypothetical protein